MHARALTLVAAVAMSANTVYADPLVAVELPPISHVQASLVVVGPQGSETAYSPGQLESFSTYSLTTTTPWREEPAEFKGVLLRDVLEASGLSDVSAISVTAENDYKTVIERAVWEELDILVATRVDGRPHSRRARGPIQFIIDMESFSASELATESTLVWMAARIEPNS